MNLKLFKLFCAYPTANKRNKIFYFSFTFILFTMIVLCGIWSFNFIVKNVAVDLENSLAAIYQLSGVANILYTMIVAVYFRNILSDLVKKFQCVCDKCKIVIEHQNNFFFSFKTQIKS